MARFCHGQGDQTIKGDPFLGGCCYLAGAVCPQRWFIDYSTSVPAGDVGTATIYDSNRNSLGTVAAYVASVMPGSGGQKAQRVQRVLDQVQGVVYVCRVAALIIGMDPSLLTDRPKFETAWANHADYQPIADHWASVGQPRNWCPLWQGEAGIQCCFGEDDATNAARAAALTATAVTVRRGREIA